LATSYHAACSHTALRLQEATPFIFPSTGTGGWESALQNTLSPGDKVVTFRCVPALSWPALSYRPSPVQTC